MCNNQDTYPHGWAWYLSIFFSRYYYNYIGGKPSFNLLQNLGTKGVLLIPDIRQLVIKDMACPDVAMYMETLIASEIFLLFFEGV